MSDNEKVHITIEGDSVEEFERKEHDKQIGLEARSDFQQTVEASNTQKANVVRARSSHYAKPFMSQFFDGRGKTGRGHELDLCEKIDLRGEDLMEVRVIQRFFEENHNRPVSVAILRDYLALKTGRSYTIEGLRAALRKLAEINKVNLLYEISPDAYAPYPSNRRMNKMMLFNLVAQEYEGFKVDAGLDYLTPPATVESLRKSVKAQQLATEQPPVVEIAKEVEVAKVAHTGESELDKLTRWMGANKITDLVIEIEMKD